MNLPLFAKATISNYHKGHNHILFNVGGKGFALPFEMVIQGVPTDKRSLVIRSLKEKQIQIWVKGGAQQALQVGIKNESEGELFIQIAFHITENNQALGLICKSQQSQKHYWLDVKEIGATQLNGTQLREAFILNQKNYTAVIDNNELSLIKTTRIQNELLKLRQGEVISAQPLGKTEGNIVDIKPIFADKMTGKYTLARLTGSDLLIAVLRKDGDFPKQLEIGLRWIKDDHINLLAVARGEGHLNYNIPDIFWNGSQTFETNAEVFYSHPISAPTNYEELIACDYYSLKHALALFNTSHGEDSLLLGADITKRALRSFHLEFIGQHFAISECNNIGEISEGFQIRYKRLLASVKNNENIDEHIESLIIETILEADNHKRGALAHSYSAAFGGHYDLEILNEKSEILKILITAFRPFLLPEIAEIDIIMSAKQCSVMVLNKLNDKKFDIPLMMQFQ